MRRGAVAAVEDGHLRVDPDASCEARWRECADVLASRARLPRPAAERRLDALLRRYPGCLVASVGLVGGGCLAVVRDGRRVVLLPAAPAHATACPSPAFASLLHAWLVRGRPLGALDGAVVRGAPGSFRVLVPAA